MTTLKLLTDLGDNPFRENTYGLTYKQAGNCCGAQVLHGFPDPDDGYNDFEEGDEERAVSAALYRIFEDLGPTASDPEEGFLAYDDDYCEDRGAYIRRYEDDGETIPMQPAVVTAYLANNQIPRWHQALIDHGFRLVAEGLCNSKSEGGVINMYVGETPTSRAYSTSQGARISKGLEGYRSHRMHDEDPA